MRKVHEGFYSLDIRLRDGATNHGVVMCYMETHGRVRWLKQVRLSGRVVRYLFRLSNGALVESCVVIIWITRIQLDRV